jgi:hypothetical protein
MLHTFSGLNTDASLRRLASGGKPKLLSPEEEAKRYRAGEELRLKRAEAKAAEERQRKAEEKQMEQKRAAKEALKEEKRQAYEADQAAKRAEWCVAHNSTYIVYY